MNGVGAADPHFVPEAVALTVNRWILTEFSRAAREVTAGDHLLPLQRCGPGAIYKFVWNQFCDWYLELLKPIFNGEDEGAKAEAQATAAYVLEETYKLMHPFMPFMTEELWAVTAPEGAPREQLLCHAEWPTPDFEDDAAADEFNWLIDLVSGIRSARSEMNVPPAATAPLVVVGAHSLTAGRLERHDAAVAASGARRGDLLCRSRAEGLAQIVVREATVCLPLGSLIDLVAEKGRLEKTLAKIEADIAKISSKLSNEKFVENAKPEVVEAEREKLAELESQKASLLVALSRIAEAG